MGRLDGAIVYASGSIEFAADDGVIWRSQLRQKMEEAGLKVDVIDPTRKPGETSEQIAESKSYQETLQREGKFRELEDFVHDYRRKDLRFVDISDFVIVLIDPDTYQCGTLNEVFLAETQHKPIITICRDGLYRLPRWLFDVVDTDLVFETIDDVVKYLTAIDSQAGELDSRWVLVRQYFRHANCTSPWRAPQKRQRGGWWALVELAILALAAAGNLALAWWFFVQPKR